MIKSGLKYRFIKLQLLVLTIFWGLITINGYLLFKNLSLKNFETTARVLSLNLVTCLDLQDKNECQRVLNTLTNENDVLEAIVYNDKNELFSFFQKYRSLEIKSNATNTDKFDYEIQNEKIYSTYPILKSGKVIGKLSIFYNFNPLSAFLSTHALYFILIISGSIFIAVLLSNRLQREFTLQINTILNTIKSIRLQKNFKLRIINEISRKDIEINEFKQLAVSFDEMIEQIDLKDQTLQARNQDLEKMVEDKTQELCKEKEKSLHNARLASLGEMAGGIAHEINNPLAIIRIAAMSLRKIQNYDMNEKEIYLDCLRSIDFTVERIAKIIMGLKNLSRHEEHNDKRPCTFKDIFEDVFAVAAVNSNGKGIEIRKKFSEADLIKEVMINRTQISQVLLNLINNSFDAVSGMENNWVEVNLKIEEKFIILKVSDSGKGIPPLIREKMFNPFYTTKEFGKGTGLGLSISKSIIENSGGQFFYDESSSNTSFVIKLPC